MNLVLLGPMVPYWRLNYLDIIPKQFLGEIKGKWWHKFKDWCQVMTLNSINKGIDLKNTVICRYYHQQLHKNEYFAPWIIHLVILTFPPEVMYYPLFFCHQSIITFFQKWNYFNPSIFFLSSLFNIFWPKDKIIIFFSYFVWKNGRIYTI